MNESDSQRDIEEWIRESDKDELLTLKRPFRANMSLIIYFILAIAGVIGVFIALKRIGPPAPSVFRYVSPRWLTLLPLGILLEMVRQHFDHLYVFAHNKLTKIEGRYSFRYNVPSIKYSDIKGIVVEQSFWGRVFNYGDVHLGTAAQEQSELIMESIGDPYRIAELVEQLRAYNLKKDDPRSVHRE
jgi:hypothetical protein